MALIRTELVRELHELIAALDRRVPQLERTGEASIARDAAALNVKALKRIADLEHDACHSNGLGPSAEENTGEMECREG